MWPADDGGAPNHIYDRSISRLRGQKTIDSVALSGQEDDKRCGEHSINSVPNLRERTELPNIPTESNEL